MIINTNDVAIDEVRDFLGLFGCIGDSGQVMNLGIEDLNILVIGEYTGNVGGLCGRNNGSITGCYTTGSINVDSHCFNIGGLCGSIFGGSVYDSYSECSIICDRRCWLVGGLFGHCLDGNVTNCYAIGNLTGGDVSSNFGGLGGLVNGSSPEYFRVSNSYASGSVTVGLYGRNLGGLCGAGSFIENCYSRGNVRSGDFSETIGGLVGSGMGIYFCYSGLPLFYVPVVMRVFHTHSPCLEQGGA